MIGIEIGGISARTVAKGMVGLSIAGALTYAFAEANGVFMSDQQQADLGVAIREEIGSAFSENGPGFNGNRFEKTEYSFAVAPGDEKSWLREVLARVGKNDPNTEADAACALSEINRIGTAAEAIEAYQANDFLLAKDLCLGGVRAALLSDSENRVKRAYFVPAAVIQTAQSKNPNG